MNNFKKKKNQNPTLVPISLNIEELDLLISYLFTDSVYINRKQLARLELFTGMLDTSLYLVDEQLISRLNFVKAVADGKLRLKIEQPDMLLTHAKKLSEHKTIVEEVIIPYLYDSDMLTDNDVIYLNNFIADHINYAFLFRYKDRMFENLEKLELGDYSDLKAINNDMRGTISGLLKSMRSVDDDIDEQPFSFQFDDAESELYDMAEELKKPSNYLKTGLQALNLMLKGGWESARTYLIMGAPGSGKSLMLLSIAYWMAKYNKDKFGELPEGKKACVLYITQENSKKETLERLWKLAVTNEDIRDFSNREIMQKFRESDDIFKPDSDVSLMLMYRKNKSISTDDLYSIIQEIEDEGYKVVGLVQDYTKRIRPSNPTGDLRLDLGAVVDEFCVLAKEKNIPVVSAAQLNRNAVTKLEAALQSNQQDIGKLLSSSDIGESYLMVENADFVAIQNREFNTNLEQWFTSLKKVKDRGGQASLDYFVQPCDKENRIRLIEDVDGDAQYKTALSDTVADVDTNNFGKRGTKGKRKKVVENATTLDPEFQELADI